MKWMEYILGRNKRYKNAIKILQNGTFIKKQNSDC